MLLVVILAVNPALTSTANGADIKEAQPSTRTLTW